MGQTNRTVAHGALIIVLLLYLLALAGSVEICPIGFSVATTEDHYQVCYRQKAPETFADKFQNCTGNLFTQELYQSLKLDIGTTIWTDFKTLYEGGPFVDMSYSEDSEDRLKTSYTVHRGPRYSDDEELCVVMDSVLNLLAVRCNEMHSRYCFVDAYPTDKDDIPFDDCAEDFWRFWSPTPTCLLSNPGRWTWHQAKTKCEEMGASLLNRGWRYSNFRFFSRDDHPTYPMAIISDTDQTYLRYNATGDDANIPQSEWNFAGALSKKARYGAVSGANWMLVNSSTVFTNNIICEKPVPIRHVNLTLYFDSEELILLMSDTIPEENIKCFTDSNKYYPERVGLSKRTNKMYKLKQHAEDGYYWCTHTDTRTFYPSESKKVLRIKVKEETINLYSVKIQMLRNYYNWNETDTFLKHVWKNKLEEYIYFSTKYKNSSHEEPWYTANKNRTIMKFRNDNPGLKMDKNVVLSLRLKRVYLDKRTVLLHAKIHPKMVAARPGLWNDDIEVQYMRPAYYCKTNDTLTLALDETRSLSDCKIYKCIGNFNEGAQMVVTAEDTCYTPVPRPSRLGSTVTVVDPTTTTEAMVIAPPTIKFDISDLFFNHTKEPPKPTRQLYRDANSSDSSEEDFRPPKTTTEKTTQDPQRPPDIPEIITVSESTTEKGFVTISDGPWKPTWVPPPPVTVSTMPTPIVTVLPTTPPPQQLEDVITDLNTLVNSTDPIQESDIQETFDSVNTFLADTENQTIPVKLVHLLDQLGERMHLNGSRGVKTVRDNVALLVANAEPGSPVRGLKIAQRTHDEFYTDAFEIIREDVNSTHLTTEQNEVVIELPDSVANASRRISFVVFRNDRAFQSGQGLYAVNSRVLSINVQNTTKFENGEVIDIHLSSLSEPGREQSRSCAFWKFLDNDTGEWSEEGCKLIRAAAGVLDTCRCDHLTHFAEILVPRTVFSEAHENALEVISIVGCVMSLVGLALVGVTALVFRAWRRDYNNKIWLQLCISIFILSVAFLITVFAQFESGGALCTMTGILLHFSVLSSFCWMLVAAVLSYRRLVVVFSRDKSHKLLRAAAFAWGAPFAVVGVLLSAAPHAYDARFEDKTPSAAFCYPSGLALWLAVFAPIALMLLANWTLFALIVRSVFASRRIQRHGDNTNEALRCASVSFFLVFLFGLPWVFGLFASNLVMAYFFVILSTFQGFVLFLFFVLGNEKTRDLWLDKLKIKQSRKVPVTSSTYTNRSTGDNVPSRGRHLAESIESRVSKPKSLASSDNSRFS